MVDRKPSRKYHLRQRAEAMAETRERITDATIELHGTVGPARTTIAGIAELAGVQRHTVYRHFPSDDELFAACSAKYWDRHHWPAADRWRAIEPGDERLAVALRELYGFYETVEPMMTNALRDAASLAVVEQALEPYHAYLDEVTRTLARGFRPRPNRVLTAAIRHAIAFPTWRSLVRDNGLTERAAIFLMGELVRAAAHRRG
jgi:AcrR family transcriptional regulator